MYVASDPRAALTKDGGAAQAPVAPAFSIDFDNTALSDKSDGITTWYARAQNFVVAYSRAQENSEIIRHNQPDEYALLLPDNDSKISVLWKDISTEISGNSVVFIPAGDSKITVHSGGQIICFYSNKTADILARCDALLPPHIADDNVPELTPWPAPADGYKVRAYRLDIAPVEGRFGRIFRCTNFMINVIYPRTGPRDRSQMSPHKHADFQQCSLCLAGTYLHHLRWPWETDATLWRDDAHIECGAPSVTIIPAGALHTSECIGTGVNQLVDVFCPPRADFSAQDGWVLNADDYPAP
ncbi:MAG: hypothetical protein JKX69_01530 [Rhodobacteraceae bacterium]|nr:hypothetical protein [Paracoccaceae bacterium]PHR53360.1 MAG: hypothetical protein COA47_16890 [Robiginitomaculum sp.]